MLAFMIALKDPESEPTIETPPVCDGFQKLGALTFTRLHPCGSRGLARLDVRRRTFKLTLSESMNYSQNQLLLDSSVSASDAFLAASQV